ncbi:MAG: DUF349 domain-containing protein [Actinomycetes bacterium]|jgi:hypothetical protein
MTEASFSPASALVGDPSAFGRVAEDGIVYVRTPEGERAVGSYPGKTPEEALAYFVRKFEAVASEVALLAARIKSGALVPSDALEAVAKLRLQVQALNGVGDLATLASAVEQIPDLIEGHRAAYESRKEAEKVAKEAKRAEALVIKEKIVTEAESLTLSESWKVTGERLKVLLDEWKAAPRLDKNADAALWKRFSASRNKFDKRRRTHFSQLEATSAAVASKKQEIVAEAVKLATSKEWLPTAKRFKELMDAWKASGRGKQSVDAKLWEQFKAAQNQFFASKNADLEKRQGTMAENLKKREELIVEIESILPVTDINSARKKYRDLSEKWFKIGMTERAKRAALDARFEKVESAIESLAAEHSRRTDPTAIARANSVVEGLVDAIEQYEEQAAKAEAAGNTAKAIVAREAAAARKVWLEEAQKGLADFNK